MSKTLTITEVTATCIRYFIDGYRREATPAEFQARYWHVCPKPRKGQSVEVPDGRNITLTRRFLDKRTQPGKGKPGCLSPFGGAEAI